MSRSKPDKSPVDEPEAAAPAAAAGDAVFQAESAGQAPTEAGAEPAPPVPDPPDPEAELAALRAERDQLRDQALRAQAELVNFQTRARREREAERRYRNESLLRDLFPVLDNFDLAIAVAPDSPEVKPLLDGIRLLQREVFRVLDLHGVKAFDCTGEAFDPARQEVLETVPSTDLPDQQVVATLRKGYLLYDRIVQVARVRLAIRPTEPESPPP